MSSAQTNMPTPDEPKTTLSSKPLKDEDFTALPSFNGKTTLPHPQSTVNHDPFGHPDTTHRTTPAHYTAVSDSILGYANKARDMVLGSSSTKPRATSTEDQAREMIGTGIPSTSYSLDKKSSLNIPTPTTTSVDRNMTHSPTLYESIATDNPAVAFGEPEDDMATYEVHKYRATHPYPHLPSKPVDTHLMELIADVQYNNGGFDEAEDAMAMYEASKYRALHEQHLDKDLDKKLEKSNDKMMNKMMIDSTWINVE